MNRTTDPLIQIISEKKIRNVLAEKRRTGKAFKNKSPKPNLRDLKKEKRTELSEMMTLLLLLYMLYLGCFFLFKRLQHKYTYVEVKQEKH